MKPPGAPVSSPESYRTLTIRDLGAQGDGIAENDGQTVFAPFTLPGETVIADVQGERARLIDVLVPSPDRAGARCAHYGVCGGCSLQHMSDSSYLAFKQRLVENALAAEGVEAAVEPVVAVPPRTRRRATFAATAASRGVAFGFHGRRSHEIIPISDCAVLTPGLLALIPQLAALARIAAPAKGSLVVTVLETLTGFDVAIAGVGKWFSADARAELVARAGAAGLARISIDGETVLQREAPAVRAGSAFLTPPPAGFLQATRPSEQLMVDLVEKAVGSARSVADLFSGAGTFSLPLAARANVHAVESDAPALKALDDAARRTPLLKTVTTERRDLFRRPLTKDEPKRFDAVVLDPPRVGAETQSRNLAGSSVKRIAYVSCNSVTFARDLGILVAGGYRIDQVTPIDQFLYSAHIEIVAALSK
ncbi:MAG: class I SAM-dependent RNA methyltransferase [Alphaproteobacteria bacterium]|nr:class I SAM-dependent RNA methyltransferase [Alphaproteobacteria bacterium]